MNAEVRLGVVGLSGIGFKHLDYLMRGDISNVKVTAVCNPSTGPIEKFQALYGKEVKTFFDAHEMFISGYIDAVLIATPHFSHPDLAIDAFTSGLHVMIEKPAGGYTKQVRLMNEAATKSGKIFSIMFQHRANPLFQKAKELVKSGELGMLKRVEWVVTDCYRSQAYYDANKWRATWSGEGGGVLLNQASHQLDLFQWICGMPHIFEGRCQFGRYHNIQTEDNVTAYFEYDHNVTGIFIASTGEVPGTNRLEIAGTKGKLVVENGQLDFYKLEMDERLFNELNEDIWQKPQFKKIHLNFNEPTNLYQILLQNWIDAIMSDSELIAPGEEGINSLTLSNAILLSAFKNNRMIELPVDEEYFLSELNLQIIKMGEWALKGMDEVVEELRQDYLAQDMENKDM